MMQTSEVTKWRRKSKIVLEPRTATAILGFGSEKE